MDKDLISVIVPVFNAASYLESRIANLINQTYPNVEFIFIDDCSTDNSFELLKSIQQAHPNKDIKIFENQQNLGPADTRNKGLALSSGKFVYFADADDIADISLLEKAHNKLVEEQSDVVFFAYQQVEKDKIKNYPIPSEVLYVSTHSSINDLKKLSFRMSYTPWSKVVRKEFLSNNNIQFPDIRFGEDMCWTMQVLQYANKVSFLNEYLYKHVINEGSLSSGKYAIQMFDYYKILKDTFNKFNCSEVLQKELVIHIMIAYKGFIGHIDNAKQKELAKALFDLPEIQNLEQELLGYSMWEKYPFYKLIPKGTFKVRARLKDRYSDFKLMKFVLDTKSLLL